MKTDKINTRGVETYIKTGFLHGNNVSGPKYPNLLKEVKSSSVVVVPSAPRHGPVIAHQNPNNKAII